MSKIHNTSFLKLIHLTIILDVKLTVTISHLLPVFSTLSLGTIVAFIFHYYTYGIHMYPLTLVDAVFASFQVGLWSHI